MLLPSQATRISSRARRSMAGDKSCSNMRARSFKVSGSSADSSAASKTIFSCSRLLIGAGFMESYVDRSQGFVLGYIDEDFLGQFQDREKGNDEFGDAHAFAEQ